MLFANSDLNPDDVVTAKAAQQAMRRPWCAGEPELLPKSTHKRLQKLYDYLVSGKLEVRLLPDKTFGLIHGKAGVITLQNGSKTSFLGSINESLSAWQEEPAPEQTIVETPVYRKELGLWAHQKYFVQRAFEDHQKGGAYYLLVDQVGLGKTVQLALAAMLMAFLLKIAEKTKSLLLATATPVQLHPIEAFDLLTVLAQGSDQLLGDAWSPWRNPEHAIPMVMGEAEIDKSDAIAWEWVRNPLPDEREHASFKLLRRRLRMADGDYVANPDGYNQLRGPDKTQLRKILEDYGREYNPFILHIVRRTRTFLENTIDPETNTAYLIKATYALMAWIAIFLGILRNG